MKNGTTFVRIRSGDHLGDAKMLKKGTRSCYVEFNYFINCDRQERFSQNERRRADLQTIATDFLIFAPGFSMIFQILDVTLVVDRIFFPWPRKIDGVVCKESVQGARADNG